MRVLITGAGGFVGQHLAVELAGHGFELVLFDQEFPCHAPDSAIAVAGDLTDAAAVSRVVADTRPAACVHMGALSFVPAGSVNPKLTFEVNLGGTINVLEAFRNRSRRAKILFISTAQVYGPTASGKVTLEQTPLVPASLYAITKAAADQTTLVYSKDYGMHTMTVRPTNHTGPGQSNRFVVPSFVRQVKENTANISVGNMDSTRDFMDVRDVVRAYRLLLEKGKPGTAYNLSANRHIRIGDVLGKICELAGVQPRITVDPAKFRPTDSSPRLSTSRLTGDTGWQPEIPFEQTLKDMLAS